MHRVRILFLPSLGCVVLVLLNIGGAAIIIGLSQVKYIFGYDVDRSKKMHVVLKNIFQNIDQFNYKTFLMGTASILLLLTMKHLGKTNKKLKFLRAIGPLTVTALAISLTAILGLDESKGIPIVASIPKGLPSFTAGEWFPIESNFSEVFLVVIAIAIVGFMESIASKLRMIALEVCCKDTLLTDTPHCHSFVLLVAKTLASKHKYEIDSSQELVGLGMVRKNLSQFRACFPSYTINVLTASYFTRTMKANLLGGMFQSYPVTGSFSRSAVNHESGAQSGISAIVTATMVGIVLLCLTAVFELLPLNVLAAIVISGVIGLLDYPEALYLWKVHKFDFGVWMTAFAGTLFLGVEIGLAIAVGVSLLIVIYESAYPHTSVLGRLPGTNAYRNVKQYPDAVRYE